MYNLMPSGASDNRSRGAREELGDKKLKKIAFCAGVRLLLRFTCKIQTSSVINRENKYRFKSLNLETQL